MVYLRSLVTSYVYIIFQLLQIIYLHISDLVDIILKLRNCPAKLKLLVVSRLNTPGNTSEFLP